MLIERFLTQTTAVQHRKEKRKSHEMEIQKNKEGAFFLEDFECDDQQFIFAVEYPDSHDESKGRYFIVATINEAWEFMQNTPKKKRHFYELIEDKTPCFPYFDLECNASDAPPIETIIEAFVDAINSSAILPIDRSGRRVLIFAPDIVLLRSLPMIQQKFSLHLIVRLPADMNRKEWLMFPDNAVLGQWVKEIIYPFLQASLPTCSSLIDMSVYTKNRTIRTAGSTKKAKESYFLPYTWKFLRDGERARHMMILESFLTKATFSQTLITNNTSCRIIPYASMCSFLLPDLSLKTIVSTAKIKRDAGGISSSAKSFHPVIDRYIYEKIDEYRNVFHHNDEEWVCYSLKNIRYCGNIGREHKRNGTYVVINMKDWTIHQRCFDIECQGYRGPTTPVPVSVREEYAKYLCDWKGDNSIQSTD